MSISVVSKCLAGNLALTSVKNSIYLNSSFTNNYKLHQELVLNLLSTSFVMNTVSNHRTWTAPHNDEGPVAVVVWSKSCLTLCDSLDCSPAGSSVHGILQAIVLKRVAISSPRGCSQNQRSNSPLMSPARFFTTSATWKAHEESEDMHNLT